MQGVGRCKSSVWALMALILGLVVVVVAVGVAAAEAEQPCQVKALYPCLASARGAYPPSPDEKCCSAVRSADSACLCSAFVATKLPESFIKNILAMPRACGRTQLSGTHCGGYTIE